MGSLQCISGQEEIFVDFNNNQIYDLNDDPAVYNGLLCPIAGNAAGWCSRTLLNVTDSAVVTMGDGPHYEFLLVRNGGVITGAIPLGEQIEVFIADTYNNPPPAGATVSWSTDGNCEVSPDTTDVFNQSRSGAFHWPFFVTADATNTEPGTVTVTLDAPTVTKSVEYACAAPPPPAP